MAPFDDAVPRLIRCRIAAMESLHPSSCFCCTVATGGENEHRGHHPAPAVGLLLEVEHGYCAGLEVAQGPMPPIA
jgi:hypothetical protein